VRQVLLALRELRVQMEPPERLVLPALRVQLGLLVQLGGQVAQGPQVLWEALVHRAQPGPLEG
jgi:hypothetical protein